MLRCKFQLRFQTDETVCHLRCLYRFFEVLVTLYLLVFEYLSGSKRKFCKRPSVSPLIDHCPTAIGWCPSTWPARERRACTSGLLPLQVSWLSFFGGWFEDATFQGRSPSLGKCYHDTRHLRHRTSLPPLDGRAPQIYQAHFAQRTLGKEEGGLWKKMPLFIWLSQFVQMFKAMYLGSREAQCHALFPLGATPGGRNREASVRSLVGTGKLRPRIPKFLSDGHQNLGCFSW